MRALRIAIPLAMVTGWLLLTSSLTLGKQEYAKKEKKSCTYCHVKIGSKDLNDVGKCYQKNKHSLEGCESKPKEEKK